MNRRSEALLAGVAVFTALGAVATALAAQAPPPGDALVRQAFAMTEPRFEPAFERNCSLDAPFPLSNGKGAPTEPARLFDNFYHVGRSDVGAWVISTSDGYVLVDTLYTAAEVERVVLPGMRKLGLDPDRIRLVLVTHGHVDHAGGRGYFQAKGVPVMMAEEDWRTLGGAPTPASVLTDGQVLTVGDTRITVLHTPGHTPGTLSFIFPVHDRGRRHVAALMGGVGPRGDIAVHRGAIAGMEHALEVGRNVGIDVLINTHMINQDPVGMQAVLDAPRRRRGEPTDLVLGQKRFQDYGRMLSTCWQARIAMMEAGRGPVGRGPGAPGD